MKKRLWIAIALMVVEVPAAIGLHVYMTYIAYHDGVVAALISFVTPPLSEIFWFGVAWHATGWPFSLYGSWLLGVCVLAAVIEFLSRARKDMPG